MANKWSAPRNIRVSSIKPSDGKRYKSGKVTRGWGGEPIYVKRTLFGYKVHDGNARLGHAARSGRGTIKARVKL